MATSCFFGSCNCWQCRRCYGSNGVVGNTGGWAPSGCQTAPPPMSLWPPPPPPQPPALAPPNPQPRRRKRNHVPRPMNPFMVWAKVERKRMSRAHPDVHNVQLSRLLGDRWRSMPYQEKLPYILEADRLKQQHLLDHPGYNRGGGGSSSSSSSSSRARSS
uniref:Sex-determining region Y protein n=1 Tax=Macrostomum lignano TaxID=282301 RepID=A0A1I8HSC7_9PLAT